MADDLARVFERPQGKKQIIFGVVVDVILPPKQTRTGDWMHTFTISDADLAKRKTPHGGIKVRIFCDREDQLPSVRHVGDVIILRNVQGSLFQGIPLLQNNKRETSYAVFSRDDILASTQRATYHKPITYKHYSPDRKWLPSLDDQNRAVLTKRDAQAVLNLDARSNDLHVTAGNTTNNSYERSRRFSLIKDAGLNKFHNTLVEVVKIFPGRYGICEVYVTDYTTNKELFSFPAPEEKDDGLDGRDGDAYGYMPVSKREWPGPFGSMTLKVDVKEPHASFIMNKVKEGDAIYLQNLRVKLSRMNKMEGSLWPDNMYPEKVLVHLNKNKDDEALQSLMARKEKYWSSRKHINTHTDGDSKPLTKNQKRKRKEKAKKAAEQEAAKKAKLSHEVPFDGRVNRHIRCLAKDDMESMSLTKILNSDRTCTLAGETKTLPFVNRNRKTTVRVVDFYPSTINEFSELVDSDPMEEDDDPINDVYSPSKTSPSKWEWSFSLLVEDSESVSKPTDEQRTRMWMQVEHNDAEFLLDLDATDLNTNEQHLAQLREKLAILWGNLEERKCAAQAVNEPYPTEAPASVDSTIAEPIDPELSNLPFQCCIREFGQHVDKEDRSQSSQEWIQVFGMFGTTIKSD